MLRTTSGGAAGHRARPPCPLGSAAAVRARRPPGGRPAARADRSPPVLATAPIGPRRRRRRDRACPPSIVRPLRSGHGRARGRPRSRGGEVTALMGRNGSGKSSLLWALQGSGPAPEWHGRRRWRRSGALPRPTPGRLVGLVPQTPADLLYLDTVAEECEQADRESGPRAPVRARRPARPAGPGHPRRRPPPRPLRGPAAGAGPRRPTGRRAARGPARRADPGPRLRRPSRRSSASSIELAADGRCGGRRHP